MRKKLVAVAAGLLSLAFAFAGCAQELPEGQTEGALALPYDDMINAEGEYDESLFYRNERAASTAAGTICMPPPITRAGRAFTIAGGAKTSSTGKT